MCMFVPWPAWKVALERELDTMSEADIRQYYQWLDDNKFLEFVTKDLKKMHETVKTYRRNVRSLEEAGIKQKFVLERDEAFERLCAQYKS